MTTIVNETLTHQQTASITNALTPLAAPPAEHAPHKPTTAPDVFHRRHEAKLVLPATQMHRVEMWLRLHRLAFRECHSPRWVNSLYFDTEDFTTLTDTIEGTSRRVKLRLRWYGEQNPIANATFELKCKIGTLGWKKSSPMEAPIDLHHQSWPAITRTIRAFLPLHQRMPFLHACRPALINRYHRRYFLAADRSVRITFDTRMTGWPQTMGLRPNLRWRNPFRNHVILEFKSDHRHTLLLSEAIDALGCRIDKHSKYATGLLRVLN